MEKLSVLNVIATSWRFLRDNKEFAFKIFTRTMPVILVLDILANFPYLTHSAPLNSHPDVSSHTVISLIAGIIQIIMFPMIAVSWHRAYLIGTSEKYIASPILMTKAEFQFSMKFMLFSLLIFIAVMPFFLFGTLVTFQLVKDLKNTPIVVATSIGIVLIAGFVACMPMLSYIARLMIYFPAKAIGRTLKFRDCLKIAKGYGFKIMLINTICIGIASVLDFGYAELLRHIFRNAPQILPINISYYILQTWVTLPLLYLQMFFTVCNISQVYKFIIEKNPQYAV